MEIKQSKPMGATHYRIQKNGRYECAPLQENRWSVVVVFF